MIHLSNYRRSGFAFALLVIFILAGCSINNTPGKSDKSIDVALIEIPNLPVDHKPNQWISSWVCFGTMPSDDHSGLDHDWLFQEGGEVNLREELLVAVGVTTPSLQFVKTMPATDGYIDFNKLFGATENSVAYAYTSIKCSNDGMAVMGVGSDDGVAVWINGRQVYENKIWRGAAADQNLIPVNLVKGLNRILVKVDQGTGDWGFYFRLGEVNNRAFGQHFRLAGEVTPPVILTGAQLPISQALHLRLFNDGQEDITNAKITINAPSIMSTSITEVNCPVLEIIDIEIPFVQESEKQPLDIARQGAVLGSGEKIEIKAEYSNGTQSKLGSAKTTIREVHPLLNGGKAGYDPKPFFIVQLSDPHIVDFDTEILKVKTADRLKEAVDEINHLKPLPEFVIVTGDIVMNTMRGYSTFKSIMDELKVPWLIAFGNHDKPGGLAPAARIASEWGMPEFYAFDYKGYRFYVLDAVADSDPKQGEIYPREVKWLRNLLSNSPTERPGLFFLHYELFSGRSISNQNEVQSILDLVPGVKWFFVGHWHMDCFVRWDNQKHVITTTTAYLWPEDRWENVRYEDGFRLIHFQLGNVWTQFKPLDGDVEDDPPGGDWHTREEIIAEMPVPKEDTSKYN